MAIKEKNSVVSLSYELKEVGTTEVLDSNKGMDPLEFVMGHGQLIPGLETQLVGMDKGDTAEITVQPADAYGEKNEDAIQQIPREQFEGVDLEIGMSLYGQGAEGETVQVIVKDFNDENVTVDYNHPLAGKELMFAVVIDDVRDATADEEATGEVGGGHCHSGGCGC